MKKVSSFYKKHLVALVLGPFVKIIEAIIDLLMPLFMKAIIDLNQYQDPESIPNIISKRFAELIRLCGTWIKNNQSLNDAIIGGTIILVLGIIGFSFTMLAQYIAARTATNVGTEIRECLYDKILHLSKIDREKFGNGRLMTCLNSDTYQVQQGILFFIRLAVRSPIMIVGALVFSFILDWRIGLAFIALVPTIVIVLLVVLVKSSKKYSIIQGELDNISKKSNDTISGARLVRAFNHQEEENTSFKTITTKYENKSIRVHRFNSFINPFVFAVTAIITIMIVFLLRNSLLNGDEATKVIVSSTLIAEMAYLAQIFFATTQLPPVLLDIVKAGVSRKRIDEILTLEESIVDGTSKENDSDDAPLFEFKDVYFSYHKDSEHYALKNINFKLNKGETLGIIGGTGSGKSTIINLLERFYDVSKGEILYKDKNIKDYNLSTVRDEIGLVNQKSSLFKGTIMSNFQMIDPNIKEEDVIASLKTAEAYEFVEKYADGLNHEVQEGGSNFSGGQKQRLCIARGIAKKPNTIILDDSTSALDLITDKKIRDNLSSLNNLTKIIISQRISTIKDADQILLIDKGEIVGMGKHNQLLKENAIYKEIYESQTRKGDYE